MEEQTVPSEAHVDSGGRAHGQRRGWSRFWLWYAFLGGPLAWAAHIGARYPLLPFACRADAVWLLHLVTAGCLVVALGSFGAAVKLIGAQRRASGAGAQRGRIDFFVEAGVVFALLFAAVIAAELLPALLADPCIGVRRPEAS